VFGKNNGLRNSCRYLIELLLKDEEMGLDRVLKCWKLTYELLPR